MATTDPLDPYGGLEGADRDAAVALQGMLKAYGLESLASTVLGYIKQGYSEDTVTVLLRETPAYRQRFSANDVRIKAGLPALQPQEYLAVEQSYRQIMSNAGLPVGFYDDASDFTKWIEQDVSPSEIQTRVQTATRAVNSLDRNQLQAFESFYSRGDIIAYALDRDRATTVLERQVSAAQAAGSAQNAGLTLSQEQAERIARAGLEQGQQGAGVSAVANMTRRLGFLSKVYGQDYSTDTAIGDVFETSGLAARQRQEISLAEQGAFGGKDNTDTKSLSRRRAGQV